VRYAIVDAAGFVGFVLPVVAFSMGTAWLGAQQSHGGSDILKESTVGKIVWQYDTGG
jgi:hypothetical protein